MGFVNDSKSKPKSIYQRQTFQQKLQSMKQAFFLITNIHLVQNQNGSSFHYYFLVLLEHFSLLWFVIHPGLKVYDQAYLLDQLRNVSRFLNFQEYLSGNPQNYKAVIGILLAYILFQIVLFVISLKCIKEKSTGELSKYIKKVVNYQFILNVKLLSGPIMAISSQVLYCNNKSPLWIGQACYGSTHIFFCILAAIILLVIISQILMFGCIYFTKNPLSKSYMGDQNKYYILSKSLIKLLLPVYFIIDFNQTLPILYLFLLVALWGGYIFLHRLLSTHSYYQQHFYVEYFMEAFIFWLSVNNILSYYIEGSSIIMPMSLFYSIFTSILMAFLTIRFEKTAEEWLFQECLSKKIKRQNMERFVFILIHLFINQQSKKSRMNFKVYSKFIMKNTSNFEEKLLQEQKKYKSELEQVYKFLYVLLCCYQQQNHSIILGELKCYLLCKLDQKCYGLHQTLQLQQKKLSLSDEFMLFAFRTNEKIFDSEQAGKISRQFVKCYRFHEQLDKFEEYIDECANNNAQYWDQLCQEDPSFPKLKNLATIYADSYARIITQYQNVNNLSSQNMYLTGIYMNFLLNVGIDSLEANKIKQKLVTMLDSRSKNLSISPSQFFEDEDMAIITINSIGHELGVILNCNINIKETLGYDKNNLIGKNVTRIMPKVFGQLHRHFLLRFIKSDISHLRPSEKVVTALNKDSQIAEMKLTVGVMTSFQNTLVFVGFMKAVVKQIQEKDKGFLIYQVDTLQILGIDAKFQKMMNYKITGKRLYQEPLKLTSILPNINPQLFEVSMCMNTLLQVGKSLNQGELGLDVSKTVKIQLRSIDTYRGVKIGLLYASENICKIKSYHSLKDMRNQPVLKMAKALSPEVLTYLNIRKKSRKTFKTIMNEDDISINVQENGQAHDEGDLLDKEATMAKLLEQTLDQKQNPTSKKLIVFTHFVYYIALAVLLVYFFFSHNKNLSQVSEMYGQLHIINSMSYQLPKMALTSNFVWSVEEKAPRTNYSYWLPYLAQEYQAYKQTLNKCLSLTKKYPVNLDYNRFNYYNFTYFINVYGKIIPITVNTAAVTIYNVYIASVATFFYSGSQDLSQRELIQLQNVFIRANVGEPLVQISIYAMTLYRDYLCSIIDKQFVRVAWLKTTLIILGIAVTIIIIIITKRINNIHKEVTDIYGHIKLWDINELSAKCNNFLRAKGAKIPKRRDSSLRRIFPIKTLLAIIVNSEQKSSQIKKSSHSKASHVYLSPYKMALPEPPSIKQPMSADPMATAPQSIIQRNDNEEDLLNNQEVEKTAKIQWREDNKMVIIAIIILSVVVIGVVTVSMSLFNKNNKDLQQRVRILEQIAEIRSIISNINYYTYLTLLNQTNPVNRQALNKLILKFYKASAINYPIIGDPQPILKNTYTYIQTIQQWLAVPNIPSSNILLGNYQIIYAGLTNASQEINKLYDTQFWPDFNSAIKHDQLNELQFIFAMVGVSFLLIFMINYLYLRPINKKSEQCLNMIKILPVWIFHRNPQAFQCIKR